MVGQHLNRDTDNRTEQEKKADQERVEAKRRAEQKQYEERAAIRYLKGIYHNDDSEVIKHAKNRWRRLNEEEAPADYKEEFDAGNQPLLVQIDNIRTSLFFKDGIYKNEETGAKVRIFNNRIYPSKKGDIVAVFDFAFSAQGGLASGVEYDVGELSKSGEMGDLTDSDHVDYLFKTIEPFRKYKERLENIEKLQNLAMSAEHAVELSLSENTKTYLNILKDLGKLPEERYQAIMQKDAEIALKAKKKQTEFLTDDVKGEINKYKNKNDIKKADFKGDNTKLADNIQAELNKAEMQLTLLQKAAAQANRQLNNLDSSLDRQEKLQVAANQEVDIKSPTDIAAKEKKEQAASNLENAIKNNSDWVHDPGLDELLGKNTNPGDPVVQSLIETKTNEVIAKMEALKELLKEQMNAPEESHKKLEKLEKDLAKAQQTAQDDTKKMSALDKLIEDYNLRQNDPAAKIVLGRTPAAEIQTKLALTDAQRQEFNYTHELLLFTKLRELQSKIDLYNKNNPGAPITRVNGKYDLDTPAKLQAVDVQNNNELLTELTQARTDKLQFDVTDPNYVFKNEQRIANVQAEINTHNANPQNQADIKLYNDLEAQIKQIDKALGNKAEDNKAASGMEAKAQKIIDDVNAAKAKRADVMQHHFVKRADQNQPSKNLSITATSPPTSPPTSP